MPRLNRALSGFVGAILEEIGEYKKEDGGIKFRYMLAQGTIRGVLRAINNLIESDKQLNQLQIIGYTIINFLAKNFYGSENRMMLALSKEVKKLHF